MFAAGNLKHKLFFSKTYTYKHLIAFQFNIRSHQQCCGRGSLHQSPKDTLDPWWVRVTVGAETVDDQRARVRRCHKVQYDGEQGEYGEEATDASVRPHHVEPHLLHLVTGQFDVGPVSQSAAKVLTKELVILDQLAIRCVDSCIPDGGNNF